MPPSSQKISHSAAHSAAEENIKTKKGSHSFGSRPKTDAIAHEQPAKDALLGAPSTRPAIGTKRAWNCSHCRPIRGTGDGSIRPSGVRLS